MRCVLPNLIAISGLSCSGQNSQTSSQDKVSGETDQGGVDIRRMVEALANDNPPPKHVGTRHKPIFAADFDWQQDARVWKAVEDLIPRAEEAWPELLSHLDDQRYCVTYKAFSGFTYDDTVGWMCCEIMLRNLSAGYFEKVRPDTKEAFLRLQTAESLRDPNALKQWCEQRRDKKLYELQIEMCDWAALELTKPLEHPPVPNETCDAWIAAIRREANSLRNSKAAVIWKALELRRSFRTTATLLKRSGRNIPT